MATATQKEIRRKQRIKNTRLLKKAGISFVSLNNGIQLRSGCYDFYPSTDRWVNFKNKESGFGIKQKVNILKSKKPKSKGFYKDSKCSKGLKVRVSFGKRLNTT